MNLNEYSEFVRSIDLYPSPKPSLHANGLAGETGEVCDKIKKIFRDDDGYLNAESATAIAKELGDVMWYVVALCNDIGFSPEVVINMNVEKLNSRKERGVLTGSGDNR